MILAIDIGNTNIDVGVLEDGKVTYEFRLKSDCERTADEYRSLFFSLLGQHTAPLSKIQECVIGSVVPQLTQLLIPMVRALLGIQPLVVGPGIRTGMEIKLADPASVGADRIINSVAARERFGSPVLVVDFGTATTIDYVNAEGCYEGGVIAPGVGIAVQALVGRTAKLPQIELEWPESVVGRSTVAAMQSGAVIGYACLVDGLIERICNETGTDPQVVATGGMGRLFSQYCSRIGEYDPYLTLKGLKLIADKNRGK